MTSYWPSAVARSDCRQASVNSARLYRTNRMLITGDSQGENVTVAELERNAFKEMRAKWVKCLLSSRGSWGAVSGGSAESLRTVRRRVERIPDFLRCRPNAKKSSLTRRPLSNPLQVRLESCC